MQLSAVPIGHHLPTMNNSLLTIVARYTEIPLDLDVHTVLIRVLRFTSLLK